MSQEPLSNRIDALAFDVEKSLRYHQRRRAHYERLHKGVMLGVIVGGSTAVAQIKGSAPYFAGGAAILGALDLVFEFSHKARDHEMLYRDFSELARQIRTKASPTEKDFLVWRGRLTEIEEGEPPIYWALEASCDNDITIAWGRDKKHGVIPLKWRHKLFMNWLTFSKTEFPPRKIPNNQNQKQATNPA